MTLDDNGTGRWNTSYSLTATPCTSATSSPAAPGLEIFKIHEQSTGNAASLDRDARTGAII